MSTNRHARDVGGTVQFPFALLFRCTLSSSIDSLDWQAATCKIKLLSSLLLKVRYTSECKTGPFNSLAFPTFGHPYKCFSWAAWSLIMQHPLQVRLDFTSEFNMLGKSDLRLRRFWIYFSNEGRTLLPVGGCSGCKTNVMPLLFWKAPLFWNQSW